jgi:hypothetical protein
MPTTFGNKVQEASRKHFKFLERRSLEPPKKFDSDYLGYSAYIGTVSEKSTLPGIGNFQRNFIKYREMYDYPIVAYAVNLIKSKFSDIQLYCNIGDDEFREVAKIAFEYTRNLMEPIEDVVKLMFLIDGKVFLRKVMSPTLKSYNKIQVLDQRDVDFTVDDFNEIEQYTVKSKKIESKHEIIYANWGIYGASPKDVKGYLDPAVRIYEQLRTIEDNWVNSAQLRTKNLILWTFHASETNQNRIENNVNQFLQSMRHSNGYAGGNVTQSPDAPDIIRHVGNIKDSFGHEITHEQIKFDIERPDITDAENLEGKLWTALVIPQTLRIGGEARNYIAKDEIKMQEQFFYAFVSDAAKRLMSIWNNILYDQITMNYDKAIDLRPRNVGCFPSDLYITNDFMNKAIQLKVKEVESGILEKKNSFKDEMKKLLLSDLTDEGDSDKSGGGEPFGMEM